MEHVNASEMIAEIKQRQSYEQSLDPTTEDEIAELEPALDPEQITYELSLDPITEDEISATTTYKSFSQLGLDAPLESLESRSSSDPYSLETKKKPIKLLSGKFNKNGQEAISYAKTDDKLVEFAATLPAPRERSKLLSEGSRVNNTDTWVKYVYRTAYDIAENKKLGEDFSIFKQQVSAYLSNQNRVKCCVLKPEQITSVDFKKIDTLSSWDQKAKEYLRILDQHYLDPESFNRAIDILNEFKNNGRLDAENYRICIEELNDRLS